MNKKHLRAVKGQSELQGSALINEQSCIESYGGWKIANLARLG